MVWAVSLAPPDLRARGLAALPHASAPSRFGPPCYPIKGARGFRALQGRTVRRAWCSNTFRRQPAITRLDWPFTPNRGSSQSFATDTGSALRGASPPPSAWPRLDRRVSGLAGATCGPLGLGLPAPPPHGSGYTPHRPTHRLIIHEARRRPAGLRLLLGSTGFPRSLTVLFTISQANSARPWRVVPPSSPRPSPGRGYSGPTEIRAPTGRGPPLCLGTLFFLRGPKLRVWGTLNRPRSPLLPVSRLVSRCGYSVVSFRHLGPPI